MSLLNFLMSSPWPSAVFLVSWTITFPLYLFMVMAILTGRHRHNKYKAVYYSLVLSQAVADFLAMGCYTFGFILRSLGLFSQFYWRNQWIAVFVFNSNHFTLMARCFGDFLVSLQRVLVLCYNSSAIHHVVARMSFPTVLLAHWLPSIVISLPITTNFDKSFDATLQVVVDANITKTADTLEVVYQIVIFSISSVSYLLILRLILQNRHSRGLTREMRLSLVVIGQSVAFTMCLTFYITQFVVVHWDLKEAVIGIRNFYPLVTGFESVANPWLHLCLNSEIRRDVWKLVSCGIYTPETSVVVNSRSLSRAQSSRLEDTTRDVRWPSGLVILFGVVTVPLYFLVVFGILHGRRRSSRFKSSYYNLVLSQALVDAIAVSSDTFTFIFRYSGLFKEFFWEHRRLLAPYSFNSNLFMMVRVFGDCLVSLQRFFVLCYPFTSFRKYFSHTPLICIMLVHWSVPILISLPITLNFNRTFDTPDTLLTVIQPTDQQLASCLEVIYQLITFSISITAYLFVFKIIVGSRSSGGLTREMRLSLIVMGQSIAFGLSLVFYTTQFIVVQLALTDAVIQLRNYYPLLTGFKSFSNPWLQIAVNCDLRREIQRMFGMRKEVSGSAKDSQSRLNNRVGTTDAT